MHRLVEMGVPRYLVAAAFTLRRLAAPRAPPVPALPQAETVSAERLGEARPRTGAAAATQEVYEPVGCPKCFRTGYRGRIGLYEVLVIDDDIRELIATGGTVLDIQRMARSQGVASLRDDGIVKVLEGLTSYLELTRVTV